MDFLSWSMGKAVRPEEAFDKFTEYRRAVEFLKMEYFNCTQELADYIALEKIYHLS